MWNLFSSNQPKLLKPSKSLKEQLLQKQGVSLKKIQTMTKQLLNTINTVLKQKHTNHNPTNNNNNDTIPTQQQQPPSLSSSPSPSSSLFSIHPILTSLHQLISSQNNHFLYFISSRQHQKNQHQQFFKQTLKSYENKKTQLNKHIQQLELRVQKLQENGYKIYQYNPKPNNVLNGINKNYVEKYINKIIEQQNVIKIMMKQKTHHINKQVQLQNYNHNHNYNHTQQPQQFAFLNKQLNFTTRFNNLNDVQKQLQLILLKQQLIQIYLNQKIIKNKKIFNKLATKQKTLKQAIKKVQIYKLTHKQKIKQKQKQNKKQKQIQNKTNINQLNTSFQKNSFQQQQQITKQKQSPQILSIDFLDACDKLITKTYIIEQDQLNNQKKTQNDINILNMSNLNNDYQ